jgi:hypothetical protein
MAFMKFGSAAPVTTFEPALGKQSFSRGDRVESAGRSGIVTAVHGSNASVLLDGDEQPVMVPLSSLVEVN